MYFWCSRSVNAPVAHGSPLPSWPTIITYNRGPAPATCLHARSARGPDAHRANRYSTVSEVLRRVSRYHGSTMRRRDELTEAPHSPGDIRRQRSAAVAQRGPRLVLRDAVRYDRADAVRQRADRRAADAIDQARPLTDRHGGQPRRRLRRGRPSTRSRACRSRGWSTGRAGA